LPSGFNDRRYELEFAEPLPQLGECHNWAHYLVLGCAIEAGKFTEGNIGDRILAASSHDICKQLEKLRLLALQQWWELPGTLPTPGTELDLLVDKLLTQLFFFHVKMYVNLPSMAMTGQGIAWSEGINKTACSSAARELLRRYLILRKKFQGTYLFDCKTSDFVGFTAAVVLVLWMYERQTVWDSDRELIREAEMIFGQLECESGCPIATQSKKALQLLSPWNEGYEQSNQQEEVKIPYFGKIIRRKPLNNAAEASSTNSEGNYQLNEGTNAAATTLDDISFYQLPPQQFLQPTLSRDYSTVDPLHLMNGTAWDIDKDWDLLEFVFEPPDSSV
jgi:hypothetical protein